MINEDEAQTVRLIFFMYLYGYTCREIAEQLTLLNRRTKKGNVTWSANSILQQLQNERHCGDVLSRKTWTPSYLDHKSKKNRQNRNQYLQHNHHEAIISRDDFIAVQHLISNAKYGNKGMLPQLTVINNGVLKGFVSVNPRWAGFKVKDYYAACASLNEYMPNTDTEILINVNSGDFDLRDYEIARTQFFDTTHRIVVTFSYDSIKFSTEAIHKLSTGYIELLVHPGTNILAIRSCSKDTKNAIRWATTTKGSLKPRLISGSAYMPTLYALFKWNKNCRYRIIGFKKQHENNSILLFDIKDSEALIPSKALMEASRKTDTVPFTDDIQAVGSYSSVFGYPETWAYTVGNNFYRQSQAAELAAFSSNGTWDIDQEGTPVETKEPLHVTSQNDLTTHIENIINEMKQGVSHERRSDNKESAD